MRSKNTSGRHFGHLGAGYSTSWQTIVEVLDRPERDHHPEVGRHARRTAAPPVEVRRLVLQQDAVVPPRVAAQLREPACPRLEVLDVVGGAGERSEDLDLVALLAQRGDLLRRVLPDAVAQRRERRDHQDLHRHRSEPLCASSSAHCEIDADRWSITSSHRYRSRTYSRPLRAHLLAQLGLLEQERQRDLEGRGVVVEEPAFGRPDVMRGHFARVVGEDGRPADPRLHDQPRERLPERRLTDDGRSRVGVVLVLIRRRSRGRGRGGGSLSGSCTSPRPMRTSFRSSRRRAMDVSREVLGEDVDVLAPLAASGVEDEVAVEPVLAPEPLGIDVRRHVDAFADDLGLRAAARRGCARARPPARC